VNNRKKRMTSKKNLSAASMLDNSLEEARGGTTLDNTFELRKRSMKKRTRPSAELVIAAELGASWKG